MELNTLENRRNYSKHQSILLNPFKLRELVKEMQKSLLIDFSIDYNSTNRFRWLIKEKYNHFGYDIKNSKKFKNKKSFYRRNCLRHKLIRIHKEFQFVNKNLQYYRNLTQRERQIVQLLVNGNNNPEIADRLFISRYTVEQHRKNINYKLKIKSFPQLMQYGYAFDLV